MGGRLCNSRCCEFSGYASPRTGLWHEEGFLRELGAIDFGGGLAIHAFGAICSLAAVL